MRLKRTTTWLALAALVMVVAVALVRSRREAGPVVAGRPLSHWLDVLEAGPAGGKTEYQAAFKIVWETKTTNPAALQSAVLDRIEAAYSTSARWWHQAYISIPLKLRSSFPKPRFGSVTFPTVILLDGIMPEPSARQRAAIEKMLSYGYGAIPDASGAAQLVALSTATQTIPESIAFLRQQLTSNDGTERLNLCESIRAKYKFDGWSHHREDLAGLLADLRKLSTSDPNPDSRQAARQALDKLTFELGASESAATKNPAPKSENSLTQASLFASPVQPSERPLVLDAPRAASELNLQLAPTTTTTATDPFKP